ncbi:aminotransferase class I/II-fold pyridoxal phosphate-dependent enzyme [Pseudomonas cremoricolorata]|uniref:aminotransferase class I/II-fold pyridoxal phosphate-dependent enzyme n=1 Tax=Pseudomonas cremoricolorata TaxID=157783 RepID=UPI000676090B|nr:pyridoxal phosphate-dependent aminotransferase family protein [Pseudomonas cremoricolorata]
MPNSLARNDVFLGSILERYERFIENGNMEVVGRVFHSKATKNSVVSYSRGRDDRRPQQVLHMGSYNYSGLNGHPRISQAAIQAIGEYGTTSSGVRLLNGTCDLHLEAERRLARFLGVEEVLTFSSGFSANLAVLGTLCRPGDVVLSDMLNHQSIVDGLKLGEAKVVPYRHGSVKSIERCLQGLSTEQRKFIVTDGVFSMDGDLAPLPQIVALARQYNAFLIVDDAHGTGHIGPNGRGTPAHFGLAEQIDVLTGSLSKGLPGVGGFVATNRRTANILRIGSNPYIFSASLPPAVLASIIAALDVLEASPEIISELKSKTDYFVARLRGEGFNLLNTQSSIVPLLTYDEDTAYGLAKALHEQGIYVNPIAYPAVSKSRARIRINLSANLTYEELDFSIAQITQAGRALNLLQNGQA